MEVKGGQSFRLEVCGQQRQGRLREMRTGLQMWQQN